MAFKITWEKDGVILNCSGVITMPDLIYANSEISGKIECDNIHYLIIDFKNVTELKVNKNLFGMFFSILRKFNRWNRAYKIIFLINNNINPDILNLEKDNGKSTYFYQLKEAREWVLSRISNTQKKDCN